MKNKFIVKSNPKIYVAQVNVKSKNLQHNFDQMLNAIQIATEQKVDLIIFSELCLPGYFNGDWWESTSNLKKCESYHKKILQLSISIDILFGSVGVDWKNKNEDGRVRKYNAAFFASKGKFVVNKKTKFSFWPKTLLPEYREFDDSRHFYDLRRLAYEKKCKIENLYEPIRAKYNNQIFKIGPTVCEDIWDENYPISPIKVFSKKYKHNLFVNLSASPFSLGKNEKRESILKKHAKDTKTDFIYANCVGTQNLGKTIYTFDGSSAVYSKKGHCLVQGKFCEHDIFEVYNHEKRNIQNITKTNFGDEFALKSILENAIKHTCEKWKITRVVIGVSGGIDSALSAVLFKQVLGADNVYLINLPTKFNSKITQNSAQKLAKNLNCPFAKFSIDQIVFEKKDKINSINFKGDNYNHDINLSQINFENIQARERGSGVLAAVASALNAVFVCNTNKSEMTIGYGTLYGDIAGFLCPIGDLWKHQVFALARYYNDQVFKADIIPNEIFALPPSAELSEEQDVLQGRGDPLIYDYHDALFASWIEHWDRKTLDDCLKFYKNDTIDTVLGLECGKIKQIFPNFEQFENDLTKWWNLFNTLGAIKRVQAPPILAVSRRAFGLDYRESI